MRVEEQLAVRVLQLDHSAVVEELAKVKALLLAAKAENEEARRVFQALMLENSRVLKLITAQREMLTAGVLQTAFPAVYGARA